MGHPQVQVGRCCVDRYTDSHHHVERNLRIFINGVCAKRSSNPMVLEMMSPIDIATVMCLIGGLEHVFYDFP